MIPSAKTALAGVIGWPIAHSRSPRLHSTWLNTYKIDGLYLPLAVRPGQVETALRGLAALGFRGVNVTVPHKEAVAAVVDRCDGVAQRIGAVNTVVVGDDGRLIGSNTDAYGFITNLDQGCPLWRQTPGPAVILGAGGAARAVIAALADAGVSPLRLVNRTREKAEALRAALCLDMEIIEWADRAAALATAGLLVNTTTLGMSGQPPLDLDLTRLPEDAVVTDIVYTPLQTPLLQSAQRRGNRVVDGLGMLLHQAVPGFEAWFGYRPDVTPALRRAVLADVAGASAP